MFYFNPKLPIFLTVAYFYEQFPTKTDSYGFLGQSCVIGSLGY